ncbi:MAG: protein phosphatase 2C domain-containing protein [Sphingobacteriaceae bacterium]|nr:protein phosphatase 2C domain-containing protein [Sphingobacteriaceae bacterium]
MIGWFHILLARQKNKKQISSAKLEKKSDSEAQEKKVIEVKDIKEDSNESTISNQITEPNKNSEHVPETISDKEERKPKNSTIKEPSVSFSNNHTIHPQAEEKDSWFIVSASAIGKSHIIDSIPCQDNHYCLSIDKEWGIIISCDGAGSAKNSHIGSKYISNEIAPLYFKDLILSNQWNSKNNLPTQEEWEVLARKTFINIYDDLINFALENKFETSSLACTIIVLIYSPIGLLISHIGDGRAGYSNKQGDWNPLMIPHKGIESNQTIFLTSNAWIKNKDLKLSGVNIPESYVLNEKPSAFTVMSDGCELHSYECSIIDKETNKWYDPNLPYPNFFKPLINNLRLMHKDNVPAYDANNIWGEFIEKGTKGLSGEPDDKTMILGVLI